MQPGDLVRVRLYGRIHDEVAMVIKVKRFKDGVQMAVQILWQGKAKWVHSDKLIILEPNETR